MTLTPTNNSSTEISVVPQDLRETPQWIIWRNEDGRKLPYKTNGGMASTTDPSHWSTFDDAKAALDAGGYNGLGFVFTKEDNFVGIDLDNCRDKETGIIVPWAEEIIGDFRSYAEVSPSGTGVKTFCKGKLPSDRGKRKAYEGGVVEMYDQGRYFAVTGEAVDTIYCDAAYDSQDNIDHWFTELYGQASSEKGSIAELDVEDVGPEKFEEYRDILADLPDAVDGAHGSYDTMHALCEIRRMRLNAEQSWELIDWFNDNKCIGPWEHEELERKWEGAKEMQPVRTADQAFDELPTEEEMPIEARLLPGEQEPSRFSFREMRGDAFYYAEFPVTWIVDGILVANDMQVIGGPTKTLKTGLSLDLTVSIAAGVPFLGEFEVLRQGPVLFCSGESGAATIHRNYVAMCGYKGIKPPRDFIFAPENPRMNSREQGHALAEAIRKYGVAYCLIDPAYLSIGAGLSGDGMKDVNRVGMMLSRFINLGNSRKRAAALDLQAKVRGF